MQPNWLNVAGVSLLLPMVRKKRLRREKTSMSVVSTLFVAVKAAVSTSPLGSAPGRLGLEPSLEVEASDAASSSRTVFSRGTVGVHGSVRPEEKKLVSVTAAELTLLDDGLVELLDILRSDVVRTVLFQSCQTISNAACV